ncbi:MAG: hypothetical protein JRI79_01405 [Deltaproteobacteria bacterium]|nr:hypothetical protein [Deltaproteobacteria bacterium]MBW2043287.1 hypothetical protein [Deltaproteobacteria bacterium]MBW2299964.1 hypothetical protein [Deltaproteobacteria bacterium]
MTKDYEEQRGSILTGSTLSGSTWPESADDRERRELLVYLKDRFGIPEALFEDYIIYRKNKSWWLMRKSASLEQARSLKVLRVGMRAFRQIGSFKKPTTRFIQVFGKKASKGKVELEQEGLEALLQGKSIPGSSGLENGYIILSLKGHVLGLGLLVNGKIISQIPKKAMKVLGF